MVAVAADDVSPIPDFGDVICTRDENGIHTNVPRRIIFHSLDGFEWGYGGSGPADFALNILSLFMEREDAWRYHQFFKWDVIAYIPPEGGIIKKIDIFHWITNITKEVKMT